MSTTDLAAIKINDSTIGYHAVKAPSKTHIKWLVEGFGELAGHQSVSALWPEIRVSRGKALDEALTQFLGHVADRPVFFHNAPFDRGFLEATVKKTGNVSACRSCGAG